MSRACLFHVVSLPSSLPRSPAVLDLGGKRALIITTSYDTLGDTGKATGVFASELTVP